MGVRPPQGQESHSGGSDGKRLRRRRRCARGRNGRGRRAAALAWAPPGFHAFDRGRIDDDEEGAHRSGRRRNGTDDYRVRRHHAARRPTPPRSDAPQHTSVVESIDSPAVAEQLALARARHDEADAHNAVPTADGGPQGHRPDGEPRRRRERTKRHPAADPPMPPVRGNGHDSVGLEIPAFLRRG